MERVMLRGWGKVFYMKQNIENKKNIIVIINFLKNHKNCEVINETNTEITIKTN